MLPARMWVCLRTHQQPRTVVRLGRIYNSFGLSNSLEQVVNSQKGRGLIGFIL